MPENKSKMNKRNQGLVHPARLPARSKSPDRSRAQSSSSSSSSSSLCLSTSSSSGSGRRRYRKNRKRKVAKSKHSCSSKGMRKLQKEVRDLDKHFGTNAQAKQYQQPDSTVESKEYNNAMQNLPGQQWYILGSPVLLVSPMNNDNIPFQDNVQVTQTGPDLQPTFKIPFLPPWPPKTYGNKKTSTKASPSTLVDKVSPSAGERHKSAPHTVTTADLPLPQSYPFAALLQGKTGTPKARTYNTLMQTTNRADHSGEERPHLLIPYPVLDLSLKKTEANERKQEKEVFYSDFKHDDSGRNNKTALEHQQTGNNRPLSAPRFRLSIDRDTSSQKKDSEEHCPIILSSPSTTSKSASETSQEPRSPPSRPSYDQRIETVTDIEEFGVPSRPKADLSDGRRSAALSNRTSKKKELIHRSGDRTTFTDNNFYASQRPHKNTRHSNEQKFRYEFLNEGFPMLEKDKPIGNHSKTRNHKFSSVYKSTIFKRPWEEDSEHVKHEPLIKPVEHEVECNTNLSEQELIKLLELKTKRKKAIAQLAIKIVEKNGSLLTNKMKFMILKALKSLIDEKMHDMGGYNSSSFLDLVIKFNALFPIKEEAKLFYKVVSKLENEFKNCWLSSYNNNKKRARNYSSKLSSYQSKSNSSGTSKSKH